MGFTKEQLRRRERLLRIAARRGRACGALCVFSMILALFLAFQSIARASYDPALDARCVRDLRERQRAFFDRHACAYDAGEASADFIAAELALRVRARHAPGPCVVMTIGLPAATDAGASGIDVLERRGSMDGALAAKMGSWVTSMTDAGAFECETRTYVDAQAVQTLKATVEKLGHDNAIVEKLWNDRKVSRQLDEDFEKAVKTSPAAKQIVLINDAKRSRSQFARFQKGLASGKVSVIIWRREITSKKQRKALLSEVRLVARFGYSVYLAGAGKDAEGKATPTAYLRVDHGAWDDIFSTPNTGIELTLVAVHREDKFKTLLDQTFGLCPVKASVLNFNERQGSSCVCDEEKFTSGIANSECSLKSRLGSSTRNWISSFLSGRTNTDVDGISELDATLERFGDEGIVRKSN